MSSSHISTKPKTLFVLFCPVLFVHFLAHTHIHIFTLMSSLSLCMKCNYFVRRVVLSFLYYFSLNMNKWVNEWTNEWMNEWMDEWTYKWSFQANTHNPCIRMYVSMYCNCRSLFAALTTTWANWNLVKTFVFSGHNNIQTLKYVKKIKIFFKMLKDTCP